nr:MAG TPA: hypothetical protein [Caudoviricetes sp.]
MNEYTVIYKSFIYALKISDEYIRYLYYHKAYRLLRLNHFLLYGTVIYFKYSIQY